AERTHSAAVATSLWKGYFYEPKRVSALASVLAFCCRASPSAICVEFFPAGFNRDDARRVARWPARFAA
ncbi:MAG: hypothetical protein ACJ8AJ_11100, partial [Gemmatimonadaceae bacterium]